MYNKKSLPNPEFPVLYPEANAVNNPSSFFPNILFLLGKRVHQVKCTV